MLLLGIQTSFHTECWWLESQDSYPGSPCPTPAEKSAGFNDTQSGDVLQDLAHRGRLIICGCFEALQICISYRSETPASVAKLAWLRDGMVLIRYILAHCQRSRTGKHNTVVNSYGGFRKRSRCVTARG